MDAKLKKLRREAREKNGDDYLPTNLTLRRKIKQPALKWAAKTGLSLSEHFEKFLEVKLVKAGLLKSGEVE